MTINIEKCCNKLRLTIVLSGLFEGGIHPVFTKKIYKTVVLTKAVYGCELWDDLSDQKCQFFRDHSFH